MITGLDVRVMWPQAGVPWRAPNTPGFDGAAMRADISAAVPHPQTQAHIPACTHIYIRNIYIYVYMYRLCTYTA